MCVMLRLSDECGYLYIIISFSDSSRPCLCAHLAVGEVTLAVCECQCTHYGTALTDEDTYANEMTELQRHIYTLPITQASQLHDHSDVTHTEKERNMSLKAMYKHSMAITYVTPYSKMYRNVWN